MGLRQESDVVFLQGPAASANGNGVSADTSGVTGAIQVEVIESNGGTATLALQGSFDGTNWYQVGYQQVDNTGAPSRAVTNISITANMKHVYQILDPYPQIRGVLSSVATSPSISVKAYLVGA